MLHVKVAREQAESWLVSGFLGGGFKSANSSSINGQTRGLLSGQVELLVGYTASSLIYTSDETFGEVSC